MLFSFVIGAALLRGAVSKGEVVEASRSLRSDSETLDLIMDIICTPSPSIEIDDWEVGIYLDKSIKEVDDHIETTENAQVFNSGLGEITAPFTIWLQSRSKDVGRPQDGGARLMVRTENPYLFTAIDLLVGGWGRDRGAQAYQIASVDWICYVKDGNHRNIHGPCHDPDWPLMNGDKFWMGVSVSETGRVKFYVGDNGEDLDFVKQHRFFTEGVLPSGHPSMSDPLTGKVWVAAGGVPLEMHSFVYEDSFMPDAGARMLSSSRMEFLPSNAKRMEEGVNQCRQVVDAAVKELDNRSPFLWAGVTLVIGLVGGYGVAARKKMVVTDESTGLLRA